MAVTSRVLQAAANTSSGAQDFTHGDFSGITPKAAIITMTLGTTNGTAVDGASISTTFTDGTNMFCGAKATAASQMGTTAFETIFSSNYLFLLDRATGAATVGAKGTVSLISGGVRITWDATDYPDAAYLVNIWMIGGSDVEALVGMFDTGDITTSAASVTSAGFGSATELVFGLMTGDGTEDTISSGGYLPNYSFGAYDGTRQRSYTLLNRDGESSSARNVSIIATDSIVGVCAGSSRTDYLACSGLDTGGFDVTPATDWSSYHLGYLALTTGGNANLEVGSFSPPGSATTGTVNFNTAFEPETVIMCTNIMTSEDAASSSTGVPENFGLGFMDDTDQYYVEFSHEDGVDNSDSNGQTAAVAIDQINEDDTTTYSAATLTTMDSDGFTLNYTTSAAAYKWFYVGIQAYAGGGGGGALPSYQYAQMARR